MKQQRQPMKPLSEVEVNNRHSPATSPSQTQRKVLTTAPVSVPVSPERVNHPQQENLSPLHQCVPSDSSRNLIDDSMPFQPMQVPQPLQPAEFHHPINEPTVVGKTFNSSPPRKIEREREREQSGELLLKPSTMSSSSSPAKPVSVKPAWMQALIDKKKHKPPALFSSQPHLFKTSFFPSCGSNQDTLARSEASLGVVDPEMWEQLQELRAEM